MSTMWRVACQSSTVDGRSRFATCLPSLWSMLTPASSSGADITVQLRVHAHVPPTPHHPVEWVSTTMTRFREVLEPEVYDPFLADYERELLAELGPDGPLFFPFSRILFVARRPSVWFSDGRG